MIAALDSSFDAPTLEQAKAAYASGVRVWGGYFGSRDGLGLAVRWNRMSFWNLQEAGITPIGFCSGWDDPDWIRTTAAEWGILACVDAEPGIRADGEGGNWIPGFVERAQCGLYGPMSVHYETGEAAGRGALFNIMAWYLGWDPQATWYDAIEPRPPGPCGWQWWGTHDEVYAGIPLSVDRSWLDDIILPYGPGRGGDTYSGGFAMGATMGGFRLGDVDHCFETSVDGDVLWGRTGGGSGGHVHVGFWNMGGSGPGPVCDLTAWASGTDIIIRTKYAEGNVLELVVHADALDRDSAVALPWYQPDNAGPFRVPAPQGEKGDAGATGPPGADGAPGATADEIADEIGNRISNG